MDAWLLGTVLLLVAYFAALAWGLRHRGRTLRGPWLFFLRAFFPNWKFFHAVGRAPHLYVRGRDVNGQCGPWQRIYPQLPRRAWHLLHNPAVNLALTQQNLIDHLAQDINDLPEGADPQHCVSYALVCRLALDALQGGHWGDQTLIAQPMPEAAAWQLELRMEHPGLPDHAPESVLMLQSDFMPLPARAA
ncbi:MAG: hypothetical protein ACKOCZ_05570 [Betaproteobacteria bacterium]